MKSSSFRRVIIYSLGCFLMVYTEVEYVAMFLDDLSLELGLPDSSGNRQRCLRSNQHRAGDWLV